MRMHLALGHGIIEPFLGTDRVTVPVVELAISAVDMDVPPRLDMLVALD